MSSARLQDLLEKVDFLESEYKEFLTADYEKLENYDGLTPIMAACFLGRGRINVNVNAFLQHYIGKFPEVALQRVAKLNHEYFGYSAATLLAEKGDYDRFTLIAEALSLAARKQFCGLANQGGERDGSTPLMFVACRSQGRAFAEYILKKDDNFCLAKLPNSRRELEGWTPFHFALESNDIDCFDAMYEVAKKAKEIKEVIDSNLRQYCADTRYNRIDAAQFLLSRKIITLGDMSSFFPEKKSMNKTNGVKRKDKPLDLNKGHNFRSSKQQRVAGAGASATGVVAPESAGSAAAIMPMSGVSSGFSMPQLMPMPGFPLNHPWPYSSMQPVIGYNPFQFQVPQGQYQGLFYSVQPPSHFSSSPLQWQPQAFGQMPQVQPQVIAPLAHSSSESVGYGASNLGMFGRQQQQAAFAPSAQAAVIDINDVPDAVPEFVQLSSTSV